MREKQYDILPYFFTKIWILKEVTLKYATLTS